MHLNDYLKSAKLFKKVIKLKPDYYRAFLALGICYEKLGNSYSSNVYLIILNNEDFKKIIGKKWIWFIVFFVIDTFLYLACGGMMAVLTGGV